MEARSWVWLPLVPEEPKVELEVFDDTVAVDVVRDDVVLDPEKEPAEREAAAAAKALKTWTGKKGCVRRFLTAERAAAAGLDWTDYFDEDGSPFIESNTISKAVRQAERAADAEEARCIKESEARRKRVRRIEEGIEDRDALRQLASSRNDGTILELEATPAGVREAAMDGTPRSAKAAGATLRALTQTFYERLLDPRFYNVEHDELERLQVATEFWDATSHRRDPHCHWEMGVRPLKRFGGKAIAAGAVVMQGPARMEYSL